MIQDELSIFPIAEDPQSKKLLEVAKKAANCGATVLISGETGVGKELVARYIHHMSPFREGPFITINCAALPHNMMEAILFGYEKGAFTSALNSYMGKFEQAEQGTLVLDEISEIPLELQGKLLRVLQEREVERLGGKKIIPVTTRIIAVTNRNLRQQVLAGLFRSDLYYRLHVLPIFCTPLRERSLDIIPLTHYFIKKYATNFDKTVPFITESAQKKLLDYAWPGNVREMDNVIQRALIMMNHNKIDENDIEFSDEQFLSASRAENTLLKPIEFDYSAHLNSKIKANEAKIIMDVLKETEGCRGIAAKKLNMSPRTLRHKISKLKLIGLKVP